MPNERGKGGIPISCAVPIDFQLDKRGGSSSSGRKLGIGGGVGTSLRKI